MFSFILSLFQELQLPSTQITSQQLLWKPIDWSPGNGTSLTLGVTWRRLCCFPRCEGEPQSSHLSQLKSCTWLLVLDHWVEWDLIVGRDRPSFGITYKISHSAFIHSHPSLTCHSFTWIPGLTCSVRARYCPGLGIACGGLAFRKGADSWATLEDPTLSPSPRGGSPRTGNIFFVFGVLMPGTGYWRKVFSTDSEWQLLSKAFPHVLLYRESLNSSGFL